MKKTIALVLLAGTVLSANAMETEIKKWKIQGNTLKMSQDILQLLENAESNSERVFLKTSLHCLIIPHIMTSFLLNTITDARIVEPLLKINAELNQKIEERLNQFTLLKLKRLMQKNKELEEKNKELRLTAAKLMGEKKPLTETEADLFAKKVNQNGGKNISEEKFKAIRDSINNNKHKKNNKDLSHIIGDKNK